MLPAEQNRLLTEVEGDAPMGRFMREQHWIPCALSEALVPDGPPERVTLLGKSYVAFRVTDGRVGFFDEACPHRGVSLVLARNEKCALQCIFHGWTFDVTGKVTHIPSEADGGGAMARHVDTKAYPTFEGAGILWVFLGAGAPPPRPPLPFLDLGPDKVWVSRSVTPCNWLQGVEGTIDSIHVGTLHQSWIRSKSANTSISHSLTAHPRYEVEDATYGLRAAAVRQLPDGRRYVRITEYVLPFVSLVPGGGDRDGTIFITTPVDNHTHLIFWGFWNEEGPRAPGEKHMTAEHPPRDVNNWAHVVPGPDWTFGQDREAMANGHFTGFPGCILEEDMIVQASMGPIVDRTKEHLCSSDVGIVHTRRRLLEALAAFELGEAAEPGPEIVRPLDRIAGPDYDWRVPA